MKIIKFVAVITGFFVTLFGLQSCKNQKIECCSHSTFDDGDTYYSKVCDDGTTYHKYTASDGSVETYTYNWNSDLGGNTVNDALWNSQKTLAESYGATCSKERVK